MGSALRTPIALWALIASSGCADEDLGNVPPPQVQDPAKGAPTAVARLAAAWAGLALHVGDIVELDATQSTDADGDPLTYAWSLLSQPATGSAALQGPLTPRPLLALSLAGTYELQLTVQDPDGLADSAGLVLEVQPAVVVFEDGPFDLVVHDWVLTPSNCIPATLVADGTVTVQRDDPAMELWFGTKALVGAVNAAEQFDVSLTQEFDWGDGCRWQSVERLVGAFSSPLSFTAAHTYAEAVVSGTSCAPPCTVTSTVVGTRAGP